MAKRRGRPGPEVTISDEDRAAPERYARGRTGRTAHDAVAEAAELPIPLGVVELAPDVDAAVDLDDEAHARSEEVDDEGMEDDLPAEAHPELATAERRPEPPSARQK